MDEDKPDDDGDDPNGGADDKEPGDDDFPDLVSDSEDEDGFDEGDEKEGDPPPTTQEAPLGCSYTTNFLPSVLGKELQASGILVRSSSIGRMLARAPSSATC